MLDHPYLAAFDLLQNIEKIETKETLTKVVGDVYAQFGATSFSCIKLGVASHKSGIGIVAANREVGWYDRYTTQGYSKIDPFVPWVFQKTKPATWHELEQTAVSKEQKCLFGEQQDYMPGQGLVVPIHQPSGPLGAILLNGQHVDFSEKAKPVLRMIAYYYWEIIQELEQAEDDWQPTYSPLTKRQTECLQWVSQGKSDWEIGQILGLSEGTVHRHIERAKTRLAVATRMQAAMISWKSGWMLV